uniref:Uncharacterized protein n=1 Tax=Zea mays TaxID=4577 RepID=C4J4B5_MAIZE|nr:unknown [Zea mays]
MPSFACQLTIWSPSQNSIAQRELSRNPDRTKNTRPSSSSTMSSLSAAARRRLALHSSAISRLTRAHSSGYRLCAATESSPECSRASSGRPSPKSAIQPLTPRSTIPRRTVLLNHACAAGLVRSSMATSNAVLGIMYGSPASSLTRMPSFLASSNRCLFALGFSSIGTRQGLQ